MRRSRRRRATCSRPQMHSGAPRAGTGRADMEAAQSRFASLARAAIACRAPAAAGESGSATVRHINAGPGAKEPDGGIEMARPVETSATGTPTRGLELLRLLNEAYPLQIRDLHALTGLPKPTISRLLTTLRAAGYVQRDGAAGYRPSSNVHVLSAGVSSQAWISEVAAPAIDRLSQAIHWPSDFAVFEGRGMTIRYTTRPTAPISISDPINTAGLPMLESDFGRAFLAFTSSEQQARILAALALRAQARRRGTRCRADPSPARQHTPPRLCDARRELHLHARSDHRGRGDGRRSIGRRGKRHLQHALHGSGRHSEALPRAYAASRSRDRRRIVVGLLRGDRAPTRRMSGIEIRRSSEWRR